MSDTKISRPRGRPRRFDPERAVATAQRLFHARGYDGLGVAEMTEALGVNPPSFYAAYGSKLGLFDRVLARYGAQDAIPLDELLRPDRPVAACLAAVLEDAACRYAAPPTSGESEALRAEDPAVVGDTPDATALKHAEPMGNDATAAASATRRSSAAPAGPMESAATTSQVDAAGAAQSLSATQGGGCLVLEAAHCQDAEARAAARAAQAAATARLHAFIAARCPQQADSVTDFLSVTLAGMSAMARNGHDASRLAATARLASAAIAQMLGELEEGDTVT